MKTSETALITGGSSGIGLEIARELAAKGCCLILVSNQEARLIEVSEEIKTKNNVDIWPVYMDLTEPGAALKLYEWCHQKNLEVGILVNNAGIFFFGEVVETKLSKAQDILLLHTYTPALLCTIFGKDMKERRRGNIVNISSLASYMPYPEIAFYSATKRFIKSFSRSLRTEMLDYNVNVTCICPGAVSTNLYNLNEADQKLAIKSGIMMRPERLARLIVRAMFRRKSILVPGFINRVFLILIYLVPHRILLMIRRHSKFLSPDKK